MRRFLALLLISALALAPSACKRQPTGTVRVAVIGGAPKLTDPALGPLSAPDAVLLGNVAQGLVRFDAAGDIVGGLAERWNVSPDGMSYIFRIASAEWPDGSKITAQQVARLVKRQFASRSRNPIKDALGAVDDVVAMTDRVIEIRLLAPRPNLLSLLAQPELAILRGQSGTGPFAAVSTGGPSGELRLSREISIGDEEAVKKEEVLLSGADAATAVRDFATAKIDVLLGGSFADLPLARRVKLSRDALHFDSASGLFGLVPMRGDGPLADVQARRLLAQALDRANFVSALDVAGLVSRATVLEPGLDGIGSVTSPAWTAAPVADRLAALKAESDRLFGQKKPTIQVALPDGPGSDLLLQELQRDWGALGITVQRAPSRDAADLALIDEVAPSTSPAWFVRHFRCGAVAICDADADSLMDAARQTEIPAQRYALLAQAAGKIDDAQLFIPIAAPVRWSLVSARIQGFAGNRYARHTLTDLLQAPGTGE